ncbi:uncharacterized protein FOMMEDRAFT_23713 [Fomitiporia mediterranea MF3/22]|uniref:uncharacterized protein n=1 Tax=Fomitiporia mediterranea (strain MF3/22) TaxID=694068 RepID=UPI000440822E|nr:uncharacterized protein FOMMEDRAFT_23713 [Fomitiporia mediterranea MF3/22]EJC98479.1 hypothetical protein FOMMEDRAFT_23713 [Fomitiporia mediterranea MF3/22]
MTFLKLVVSPAAKPAPSTSSTSSTEALLKKITPRRTPKRRTLFNLPCFVRQKEQPRSKRESRRALRPLLLNNEAMYTYTPRSPIDDKTQELLRSPDAFAEFSDPVRNMNFVRMQDEVQLRKERDEIWYEEPLNSPEIPSVACVAPLALRKKCSLLREGDKTDDEQAPIERSPGRVIYPPPPIVVPATPPSTVDVDEKQNVIYYPSYDTTRPLSIIEEEDPDSPAPRSFFEICGDEDDDELRRRKIRLRFPLPSPIKASLQNDIDVFSIGSFSVSDESSDGSGH